MNPRTTTRAQQIVQEGLVNAQQELQTHPEDRTNLVTEIEAWDYLNLLLMTRT